MRRAVVVAFALLASLLIVTAQPAAATGHLATGSIHTTEADFNAAAALKGVSVVGAGSSADVELDAETTDGSTATRPDDGTEGNNHNKYGLRINPNTDLAGVTLTLSSGVGGVYGPVTHAYIYETATGALVSETTGTWTGGDTISISADLSAGTTYHLVVDDGGTDYGYGYYGSPSFPYTSSDIDIVGGATGTTSSYPNAINILSVQAILAGQEGTTVTRPADDDSGGYSIKWGVRIVPRTDLVGINATISSNAGVSQAISHAYIYETATGTLVGETTGSWSGGDQFTITASLDKGTTYNLVVNNEGNRYTYGVYRDNSSFPFTSANVDIVAGAMEATDRYDGGPINIGSVRAIISSDTGTYQSDTHDVDGAAQGFTDLTLSNATAEVTWRADTDGDGSFETTAASGTYTTSGNKTLDVSGTTSTNWRVTVTFEKTGLNPTAQLHDEGLLFDPDPPGIANATASPSGGATVRTETPQLSVDLSDADFSTAQGDTLTAEWYIDGVKEGETTVNSNGTASFESPATADGAHTWHVVVTDSYGETTTSQTFSYTIDHFDLQVDNASATPQGGTAFNDEDVTASIQINDSDFTGADGDSLTVRWSVDGVQVATDTGISSNGTVSNTFTNLDDGSHTWSVEVEDSYGEVTTSQTFGFEVQHWAPEFNNSGASPKGGAQLTQRSTTLSIPVNDTDFAETSGDTVEVNFTVDGNLVGSDTLTENDTATTSTVVSTGGTHTWSATATDEYGNTSSSQTFSFQAPSDLLILNESDPTQLVTGASVELRFYVNESGNPQIFTLNTSDGSANMTGLPADEPFIVVAEADGYYTRRIFVQSLYQAQQVFLLPTNMTAVPVTFEIQDYTGVYPQEDTVLIVQRALNGSYQTVLGDFFGATGEFPATLAYNKRHRLILLNVETGVSRQLGSFTPQTTSAQRVVVSPEGDIDDSGVPPTISMLATGQLPSSSSVPFEASLQNGSLDIQSWNLTLSVNGATVFTTTGAGSATIDTTVNLSGYAGEQLNATLTYTLGDGSSDTVSRTYTITDAFANDDSLLNLLGGLVVLVPAENQAAFTTFLAMALTVFGTAGVIWAVPMSPEFIGATAWFFLAAFAVIGWVSYDMLFVAGIAAASFAYLRRVA